MKCKNCPFTLLCYADRFALSTLYKYSYTCLCFICGRLNYVHNYDNRVGKSVYSFFCPKRKVSSKVRNDFSRDLYGNTHIRDPMSRHRLWCVVCAKCIRGRARSYELSWMWEEADLIALE